MKILLAGVGGQGILFTTRVLAELALRRDLPIVGAETHGMAQRGGSVVSHLKIGLDSAAPLIRRGTAELLFGLEENEGLRYMDYLAANSKMLLNISVGKYKLPAVQDYIRAQKILLTAIPASRLAEDMDYTLGANLILLGAAQALGWLPFSEEELNSVVQEISKRPFRELNLRSLEVGYEFIAQGPAFAAPRPS